MVARGAAIFGAGKGGVQTFLHDGDGKEMLNVSAADVLPGRVVLAERSEDGQMRYIEVRLGTMCIQLVRLVPSSWDRCVIWLFRSSVAYGSVILLPRIVTQVLKIFAPPSTKHTWLNNPQTDPSLVFCVRKRRPLMFVQTLGRR